MRSAATEIYTYRKYRIKQSILITRNDIFAASSLGARRKPKPARDFRGQSLRYNIIKNPSPLAGALLRGGGRE